MSVAGGVSRAVDRAVLHGCEALQIFTKNASRWRGNPLDPDEVTRPDDGFVDSHDAQPVLLGRLNQLYGVAGAAPATALKGRFGFITD